LKLTQVICENCTMSRDLDFCRDEDLIPENGAGGDGGVKGWKCHFCESEYDRLGIEERLIAMVMGWVAEWNGMDVKCGKCKSVRVNDFMEHCACSGQWVEGGALNRGELERRVKVVEGVGRAYGLRMLGAVVGEVLGGL